MVWPNYWSLLPILGTVMVLYAQKSSGVLVSSRITKIVGLTSYSVYLWHWPIVVAIAYFDLMSNVEAILIGLLVSFLVGWLSYAKVELVFSAIKGSKIRQASLVAIPCVFAVGSAIVIFISNGISSELRFEKNILIADKEYLNREPMKHKCLVEHVDNSPHCIYGDKSKDTALVLLGDSHASAVVSAVTEAVSDKGNVVLIAYAGCLPIHNGTQVGKENSHCSSFVTNELNYIREHYQGVPVLMVNRWSYYLHGKLEENKPKISFPEDNALTFNDLFVNNLRSTLCELGESNSISLLAPIPEFKSEAPRSIAKSLLNRTNVELQMSMDAYLSRNANAISAIESAALSCNVKVYDPLPYLCQNERCLAHKNGRPLYYDDNHLSEFGNRLLIPLFEQLLN